MIDNGNLKLASKLTEQHVTVKGQQRQRVNFAAQLISGTVSKALKFLGEHGEIKIDNWLEASELIQLINDWFDIFNSSIKRDLSGKINAFQKSNKQMKMLSDTVNIIVSEYQEGTFHS